MVATRFHISSKISYILFFLAFLMSSRCWIGFEGRGTLFFYILPVILLALIFFGEYQYRHQSKYVIFAFLIFLANCYTMYRVRGSFNIIGIFNQAILPITVYMLLCLQEIEKDYVLAYITKWFGLILIPGMIIYVCSLFITLPSFGIIQTHYGGNIYGDPCFNYLFYIKPISLGATGMYRFNGPLIEPGDLGCISAFLLYATKFDFKKYKYLWAVFISQILTFSLAGYLLTFFGYSAVMFAQKKSFANKLFLGFFVVLAIIGYGIYYNGGDNNVNTSILSRLQDVDLSSGNTSGRLSTQKLDFFYAMFETPNVLLYGYDRGTISYLNDEFGIGAGFYNIALSIGFLGILLYILPYLYITSTARSRSYALLFFAFLILYLYQRFDLFWISIILCYSYGISINDNKKLDI